MRFRWLKLNDENICRQVALSSKKNTLTIDISFTQTAYLPSPPAFVDSSSYVANLHKASFSTVCGESVLISPHMHCYSPYTVTGPPTMANERLLNQMSMSLTNASFNSIRLLLLLECDGQEHRKGDVHDVVHCHILGPIL